LKIGRCRLGGQREFWAVIDPEADTLTRLVAPFGAWAPELASGASAGPFIEASPTAALSSVRLAAPLAEGAKVVCIGRNYRPHVEAVGLSLPSAPVAFLKARTAVVGPYDEIRYPALTRELDFELELAVVIAAASGRPGQPGRSYAVLGYTVGNDVSARDLQRGGDPGPDLYSGKSLDDTCPIGPWIVTADELGTAPDLEMVLTVNGERRQHDRTSSMHRPVDDLLGYIDARTRLIGGDIVFTGTPAGVGLEDGRFLRPRDVIESEIVGIGTMRNRVADAASA
jgi:2-keto-4-pentenoate hydratase/2-oxohepta-3-ene-1,7-dioic acid hydratase in catechol pathway